MQLWVLSGDDDEAIRSKWASLLADAQRAGGAREDVDCAVDGGAALVSAVCSPAMFGPRRIVAADNFASITPASLAQLVAGAPHSDAAVIARTAGTLPAATKKALATTGELIVYAVPRGAKGVGARVDEIAAQTHVTLTAETRRILVERAGHDLDRVRSALVVCDLAGVPKPGARQINLLLGSSEAPGVSWAITDALDRGDVAAALQAADGLSAFAVLGYLASQLEAAGRLIDAGCRDADAAMELLGTKTTFQAQKALTLARRLGRDGIRTAWQVVAEAQSSARSTVGDVAALDVAIARLAPVWSPRR